MVQWDAMCMLEGGQAKVYGGRWPDTITEYEVRCTPIYIYFEVGSLDGCVVHVLRDALCMSFVSAVVRVPYCMPKGVGGQRFHSTAIAGPTPSLSTRYEVLCTLCTMVVLLKPHCVCSLQQ